MSDTPIRRLTAEQIGALRFAANRQLARWSDKPALSPHQQAQRTALRRAAQILKDDAFSQGCELHASTDGRNADA